MFHGCSRPSSAKSLLLLLPLIPGRKHLKEAAAVALEAVFEGDGQLQNEGAEAGHMALPSQSQLKSRGEKASGKKAPIGKKEADQSRGSSQSCWIDFAPSECEGEKGFGSPVWGKAGSTGVGTGKRGWQWLSSWMSNCRFYALGMTSMANCRHSTPLHLILTLMDVSGILPRCSHRLTGSREPDPESQYYYCFAVFLPYLPGLAK
jgi:hypothetical protein